MAKSLVEQVAAATGLPSQSVLTELRRLVSDKGYKEDELTLDHLREVVAEYLQDVLSEVAADSSQQL